ncbi:hypothetical protein A2U01_0099098, partial [Trifolium medium]|nr:hypothetical protein [Trifolium medium]
EAKRKQEEEEKQKQEKITSDNLVIETSEDKGKTVASEHDGTDTSRARATEGRSQESH